MNLKIIFTAKMSQSLISYHFNQGLNVLDQVFETVTKAQKIYSQEALGFFRGLRHGWQTEGLYWSLSIYRKNSEIHLHLRFQAEWGPPKYSVSWMIGKV